MLRVAHDGALQVDRGLIHPDDMRAEKRRASGISEEVATPSGYSAALIEDLTAHRTAALRIELSRKPAVALAVTVHALAASLLYQERSDSCLTLEARSEALERHTTVPGDSGAHREMEVEAERWTERLPSDADDVLAWCLAQPQDTLLDLLISVAD